MSQTQIQSPIRSEQIQVHPIMDIYRLQPGVLLHINKYQMSGGKWVCPEKAPLKGKLKREPNTVEKIWIATEDIITPYDGTIAKGSFIHALRMVIPTTDPKEYWVELKVSGGAIIGSIAVHRALQAEIERILNRYSS